MPTPNPEAEAKTAAVSSARNPEVEKPPGHFLFDKNQPVNIKGRCGNIYYAKKNSKAGSTGLRNSKEWVLKPIYDEASERANVREDFSRKDWIFNAKSLQKKILVCQDELNNFEKTIVQDPKMKGDRDKEIAAIKKDRDKLRKSYKLYYEGKTYEEYLDVICEHHRLDIIYRGSLEVIAQEFFRWIIPGQPKNRLVSEEEQGKKKVYIATERIYHRPIPLPFVHRASPNFLVRMLAAITGKTLKQFPKLSKVQVKEETQNAKRKIEEFKEDLITGEVFGLGGILAVSMMTAERDLNLTNIIINESGQLIKLDGEESLSMLKVDREFQQEEFKRLKITAFDLRHLTSIRDFPASRWLWLHNNHPLRNKDGHLVLDHQDINAQAIINPEYRKADWFLEDIHYTFFKLFLLPDAWIKQFVSDYAELPGHADLFGRVLIKRMEWYRTEAMKNEFFLRYLVTPKDANGQDPIQLQLEEFLEYQSRYETRNSRLILDSVYSSERPRRDAAGNKYPTCHADSLLKAKKEMEDRLQVLRQQAQLILDQGKQIKSPSSPVQKQDKKNEAKPTKRKASVESSYYSVLKGSLKGALFGCLIVAAFIGINFASFGLATSILIIISAVLFVSALILGVIKENCAPKADTEEDSSEEDSLIDEERAGKRKQISRTISSEKVKRRLSFTSIVKDEKDQDLNKAKGAEKKKVRDPKLRSGAVVPVDASENQSDGPQSNAVLPRALSSSSLTSYALGIAANNQPPIISEEVSDKTISLVQPSSQEVLQQQPEEDDPKSLVKARNVVVLPQMSPGKENILPPIDTLGPRKSTSMPVAGSGKILADKRQRNGSSTASTRCSSPASTVSRRITGESSSFGNNSGAPLTIPQESFGINSNKFITSPSPVDLNHLFGQGGVTQPQGYIESLRFVEATANQANLDSEESQVREKRRSRSKSLG